MKIIETHHRAVAIGVLRTATPYLAPAPSAIIDRPDRPSSIVAPIRHSLKRNRRRRQQAAPALA
jgi:hypothetical protein